MGTASRSPRITLLTVFILLLSGALQQAEGARVRPEVKANNWQRRPRDAARMLQHRNATRLMQLRHSTRRRWPHREAKASEDLPYPADQLCTPNRCNGNGECLILAKRRRVVCKCNPGFVGEWCESPEVGATNNCNNTVQDGAETDVDCGGTTCQKCLFGKQCLQNSDCVSGKCGTQVVEDVLTRICLADTGSCLNGRLDGGETDIDCGGPNSCPRCQLQMKCNVGSDCLTGSCDQTSKRCRFPECTSDKTCGEYGCAKCDLATLTCNMPAAKGTTCPQRPADQCDGFGKCVECTSAAGCTTGQKCLVDPSNSRNNKCVECFSNSDCPCAQQCIDNSCKDPCADPYSKPAMITCLLAFKSMFANGDIAYWGWNIDPSYPDPCVDYGPSGGWNDVSCDIDAQGREYISYIEYDEGPLDANGNMIPLIGPIDPQRWFLPKTLEYLWLGDSTMVDNEINSPLPHACTLPDSLVVLDLSWSTFTGTIPPSWLSPSAGGLGMPESLELLIIAYNRLGGCMPANWGFDTCGCFAQLYMQGNNFIGPVREYSSLTIFSEFYIQIENTAQAGLDLTEDNDGMCTPLPNDETPSSATIPPWNGPTYYEWDPFALSPPLATLSTCTAAQLQC